MRILCIGEIVWDVFGNVERLGGAPFNFAVHATRLGHDVSFITAVGADERGRRALEKLVELGLSRRYVRCVEDHPTGSVTVVLDWAGRPHYTIHRPAAYDFPTPSEADLQVLSSQRFDWIYFGTVQQTSPPAKALTRRLIEFNPSARRLYDVNLRVNSYEAALVRELMSHATIFKISDEEICLVEQMFGRSHHSREEFCRRYSELFGWEAVCVTRGARGCALLIGGEYLEAAAYHVRVADTVGAGDAFAAAFVHGLSSGWSSMEIADFANRVGALVASRDGAVPVWTIEEARALLTQDDGGFGGSAQEGKPE